MTLLLKSIYTLLLSLALSSVLLLGLGACAFSPQKITISPQLQIPSAYIGNIGGGKRFTITVKDIRESKIVGYRGGVYRNSSTIKVLGLEKSIGDALSSEFQQLGYVAALAGDKEDVRFAVFIDSLNYGSPDVLYSNKVVMDATIRVEVFRGSRRFNNSYTTQSNRRFTITPNRKANQQLIAEMVSSTLARIFSDARFLAFIS